MMKLENEYIMQTPNVKNVNLLNPKMEHVEFLYESNLIENEPSMEALEDAVLAWDYIINKKKFDLDMLLGAHYLLLHRLNPRIAGKVRNSAVWIGEKLKHFPSKEILEREVTDWLKKCNDEARSWDIQKTNEKEANILRWHVLFEEIHPFEDGNGRIGRILMNRQRVLHDLKPIVIHSGDEQKRYYDLFNGLDPLKFIEEHKSFKKENASPKKNV